MDGLEIMEDASVSDKTATDEAEKMDPSKKKSSCKGDNCSLPNSKEMLACKDCKRSFYYNCTKLPPYAIHILASKKQAYICWYCYGVLDSFMELLSSQQISLLATTSLLNSSRIWRSPCLMESLRTWLNLKNPPSQP